MLKLLIVDDEPEVRELLTILLRRNSNVELIGEAANVDEAMALTIAKKPDLILLDIQMPEKDGFMFLEELREKELYPGVIFVTAFENYAIKAIRNAAFDYLLKPIDKDELFASIARFQKSRAQNKHSDLSELIDLLNKSKPGRIRLNTRSGYFFVDPEDIIYCEADGNYSHIKLNNNKKEISTLSLGSLEKLLEEETFLRISRSFIINMKYIARVDRKSNTCDLEYSEYVHQIKIPPQKIKMLEGYF